MNEILSLWRSPLDRVALSEARALAESQPRCSSCLIYFNTDFSAITVYNYGRYNPVPGGSATINTTALTAMFNDILAAGTGSNGIGGAALIEQATFPVNATSSGLTVPDQCNIIGTGGGGTATGSAPSFFHFVISRVGTDDAKFFNCTDAGGGGGHTSGGMYFRSLAFQWASTSDPADTCIHAAVWNARAIDCTFTDCPRAFDAQGVSCTLEQCTINYTVGNPGGTKAVVLGGQQCGVLGPGVFSQTTRGGGGGGAHNCTCISIEAAEHAVVADLQIYEWAIGIDFSQLDLATIAPQITNCEIICWQTALNIQLHGTPSATTAGIKVTSCTLAKASDSNDGNPIVLIDARGSAHNSLLNDVALTDCTIFNMSPSPPANQYGLQITSGSNIRVIGGTYSNNSPTGGAGIAITDAVSDLQIIGVNLQPSYPGSVNQNSQQYGLYVSAAPANVVVDGCDFTGYTTGGVPVKVTVTQAQNGLLITNCPGYNDQNTLLAATGPSLTTGVSAATCVTPYFGPSVFAFFSAAPVSLHIFGQTITLSTGIFFLPSPYDSFRFSAAPASFSWTGK